MTPPVNESPPWSHPVALADLARGRAIRLVADTAARARIARALGEPAVKRLEADLTAEAWLDGARISGRVSALVTRVCGVSLVEFDEAVDESFVLRLAPPGSPNAPRPAEGEVEVDLDGDDPPEALSGDTADVAALVVQILDLALAPFPRAPGAVFEAPGPDPAGGPFARLAALKPPPPDD